DNGGLDSLNPIQVNVQVAAVNDRPVVTAGATLAYTENDSPIVIDAGLLVSDVDDSHISGATVTIGQVVPGDLLGFTNQNGITGTYVSQTGTLTLSGAATVAQYQQALRSVTFSSTNEDPTLNNTRVNRTISWVVTDSNSGNASNGVLTSDGGSGVSTTYLAGSTYTLNSNGTNPYVIPMDLGQNWSFEAEFRMNSSNGLNTLFSYGNYTDGVLIRTLRSDSLYVKGYDFNQIDVFGTSNTNGSFVPVKITYTTTGTTGTLSIYAAGSLVKSVTSLSPLNPVDKTIRIGSAHHSNGEGLDGAVRNINVTVGIGSGDSSQVNITAVNDAPTLQTPEVITVRDTAVLDRFGVISSGLVGSDVDANTTLTYGISGGTVQGGIATKVGTYGTLVLTTSTGAYTFTPNNAAINALTSNTTERFTIGVSDGIVTTDADLEVRLVAANDTPIVVNIAPVVYTNTNAVDVFANATGFISASDADSSAVLAYGISGQGVVVTNGIASLTGLYGTLSVEVATGQYTYSPNQNQLDIVSGDAVDNFTVTVSDGIASVNKPFVVNINDRETPSVTISSNVSRLKAGEFANITFTFSEVPVGFDLNSLNVAGGVLSNLTGSGTSYSARFTPTINSIIPGSISFKANSYKDSANNFGSGSVLSPLIGIDTLRPLAPVVALASDTGISAIDKVTYSGIVTVSGIE
ncbi:hypothetical protein EBX93_13830, partial [bacterium]|nr:hypothetical protein [bacterium]